MSRFRRIAVAVTTILIASVIGALGAWPAGACQGVDTGIALQPNCESIKTDCPTIGPIFDVCV